MEADLYLDRWTVIIRDEHDEHGHKHPMPPWKEAMPPGSSFFIARDASGSYWFLPSQGLGAPMDQTRKLAPTGETHGDFGVGALLPGTLCADLGGKAGKLHFSLSLINDTRRIINVSQTHGGLHGVNG